MFNVRGKPVPKVPNVQWFQAVQRFNSSNVKGQIRNGNFHVSRILGFEDVGKS
jgi:hypothetical protein